MALTEQKIINAVTVKPDIGAIEVQWKNQILRDGVEISYTYERRAYVKNSEADDSADFSADVPNSQPYMDAAGWS